MAHLIHVLAISLLLTGPAAAQASRAIHEGKAASNNAVYVDTPNARVGISTGLPQATLDVNGNTLVRGSIVTPNSLTASSGAFTATGASTYGVDVTSGVRAANVKVKTGGFVEFGDGTTMITAATGGGGGSTLVASTAAMNWGNPYPAMTSGTTIYAFIPTQQLTLHKLCVTIHTADNSSTGSYFICDAGGAASIVVRTVPSQTQGTVSCATGTVNVAANAQGSCYLNSDAGSKPLTNNYLEYTTP